MRSRFLLLVAVVCAAFVVSQTRLDPLQAQARDPMALTGQVTSAGEGPMEGVLVGVKKTASTITTTVVTDSQGRYRFPRARLTPGQYALRVRAVGFDLESAVTVDVAADKTTTADLKLTNARDLASQLSNAEWLASVPGTDAQKASIRPCTHCHTLERILRTKYNA